MRSANMNSTMPVWKKLWEEKAAHRRLIAFEKAAASDGSGSDAGTVAADASEPAAAEEDIFRDYDGAVIFEGQTGEGRNCINVCKRR